MMRTSRYTTSCLLLAATLCWSFPTSAGAKVIGRADNVVPSTIRISPDGDHVLVVSVDPKTKKRRVNIDGRPLPGVYDAIAEARPFLAKMVSTMLSWAPAGRSAWWFSTASNRLLMP